MAETVRIEIPIETIDNTDPELSKVTSNLKKMGDAADKANTSAKKANTTVTQFDKSSSKTQKTLSSWAKEKYEVLLEAKDKVGPVLTTLGSNLKNVAGKAWSVTMKAVDLATAPIRGVINLLKNPILQVGAVLGISVGLSDTINTYMDFEAAMSEVSAISGATGNTLTQLTNKAKEMGSTTKFTATEAAEAFTYMGMAGWNAEQMMDGIEGVLNLAAASGEDLGTTSDIVTDALTAFKLQASDAAHFSDVLAAAASNANTDVSMMGETFKYAGAMAGTLGYSIEDVGLMVGLMANSGIKASQAGTQLNSIFTRLSTNTNGAADAIQELGINFFDDAGNARDLSDVIGELRVATADYTDEQKTNLANTIAGTRAQAGLLSILNASETDYNKLAEAINNADGAAENMADTMLDNLSGSITLLQSAMDGVKISFGERLAPYLRGIADWLTDSMPAIEQGLDELMDWVDIKVENLKRKFGEITQTEEWGNADFFGKAHILWDEFIVEPFSEWWNGTGKSKIAGIAQNIGQGIGSGLKFGIMTLLGIDISETVDEGMNIGRSFASGFTDGLDFNLIKDKIWEGLGNLFSSASKLLPGGESADLSSVLSAAILAKIASPFISIGKGVGGIGKGLFGSQQSLGGASLMGTMVGSASAGTGLLGLGSTAAINLGAGNLAGGASLGAAGLSAVGLGSIAGGAVGGATLISGGIDAYKAIKSDDSEEKSAYASSAGLKIGGVAAGAAAGAAIGSVVPVLGTAVGALIGAGIGGIGGWLAGNKVKEDYQESVEEAQKQAELARKAFEVTGLSIDEVKFKNEALNDAMQDTELSAQDLAVLIQEDVANTMSEAFGDVSLSLAEVKSLAQDITFGNLIEGVNEFASATTDAENSLYNLQSSVTALKKENWRAGLGLELDEGEQDNYKKAIDTFVESAKEYIDNNHYQATVALTLLNGSNADTSGLDSMYESMTSQVESLATQLSEQMEIALTDGIITLDESAELLNLQNQISEITNKLSEAQEEATLEAIQIKYSGAQMDAESFTQMQAELQAQMETFESNYDEALTVSLTNLKLQLSEGAISQEDYDAAVQELKDNYSIQINGMSARIESFNLDTIATAWSDELEGILPDIKGTTAEKLSSALHSALLENPDPVTWTQEDVKNWFDLSSLASSDTSAFENIYSELVETAKAVPEGTKEEIIDTYVQSIPTADEIMAAIDWDSMTFDDYDSIYEKLFGPIEGPVITTGESGDTKLADYYGEYFESVKESYSTAWHNALENNPSNETLSSFMEQYMTQQTESLAEVDFIGPYSQAIYDQLALLDLSEADLTSLKESLSTGVAQAVEDADMAKVNAALDIVKGNVDLSAQTTFGTGYDVTIPLRVTFDWSVTNPTLPSSLLPSSRYSVSAQKNAAGGYVSGGPQLSWLAEEGYGEFIIPTNPSRRSRALDLYAQAGEALGVQENAAGGYVGGSKSAFNMSDYNLLDEALSNVPTGYMESTEGNREVGATSNEPVSETATTQGETGATIQVSVQMSPEFNISGADGMDEESIMQIIRKNMKAMADELGGEIAERLEDVFSNMPLKEA